MKSWDEIMKWAIEYAQNNKEVFVEEPKVDTEAFGEAS